MTHLTPSPDRPYPPVAWFSTAALATVVLGGIVIASFAPRHAPTSLAAGLLALAAVLMVIVVVTLARLRNFSWSTFGRVFKWALLAYVIEASVIEFAFIRQHASGSTLGIVSGMLLIFATSVPTTIAFTVARYADLP